MEPPDHNCKTVVHIPEDGSLVLQPIAGRFLLLEASDNIDQLLDWVAVDFSRDQARLLPQLSDGQKAGTEHIDAQVHILPEVRDVPVDSARMVVAIANTIANSIESYAGSHQIREKYVVCTAITDPAACV